MVEIDNQNYWACVQIIPFNPSQISDIIFVMFFVTPQENIEELGHILNHSEITGRHNIALILISLNLIMLAFICFGSVRWTKKITNSIKILNEYTSMLKQAQDRDNKDNVVSKVAKHQAFKKISKQYDANITLNTFQRTR